LNSVLSLFVCVEFTGSLFGMPDLLR